MTRERWEQILFANVPDEVVQDMLNAYVLELEAENAKLRERITTQKQTIQAYRDESREWQEIAEARGQTIDRMSADNASLQELCEDMLSCIEICEAFCKPPTVEMRKEFASRMYELGVEVEE